MITPLWRRCLSCTHPCHQIQLPPLPTGECQERDAISKRISSEESTLEQLRAKLHGVLQEAKVEQVALPLVGGGTLAGGGGSSGGGEKEKSRGRKRGRGDGDGEDDEDEEEEEESEEVSATIACRAGPSQSRKVAWSFVLCPLSFAWPYFVSCVSAPPATSHQPPGGVERGTKAVRHHVFCSHDDMCV